MTHSPSHLRTAAPARVEVEKRTHALVPWLLLALLAGGAASAAVASLAMI